MKNFIQLTFLLLIMFLCSCIENENLNKENMSKKTQENHDPLPSWNDGATKTAIIDFVTKVTTEGSDFVPVEDRIASFDNDGNLWAEQPVYFQIIYAMDRIKAMADQHPEWNDQEPYKSIIANDMKGVMKTGMKELMQMIMTTHTDMTSEEYEAVVAEWLQTSKHPKFDQPYNAMVYQPMIELLDYLRSNEFKTFIVSGGGIQFMRVWATEAYDIPSHQIVGSSVKSKFEMTENGEAKIVRLPEINFIDDRAGKPVGIYEHIGKKPIFASGNSDGDLQMLQYTDSNAYPSFQLYLHHTDAEREWAYDRDSHIGKLDKGLDEAEAKGWTVVNMKKDWNIVFPFEKTK
ncbi:MAG: haloacid dehalogenase-like hydrolase [Psychroserpens sp.]|nr:haloacid dehalogenase-like hydrolase [Psychroserpens sp.]